jgi:CP family cyanate transporter-like MFS transporter
MIPLQKQLNNSWQLALGSWGAFAIIGLLFWYPMVKKSTFIKNSVAPKIHLPLKNKKVWLYTMIFGLQAGLFYCISTWLAPYAQAVGFSKELSGSLITFFTIIQMLFNFVIPTLADLYKNHRTWLMVSTIFALFGLLFIVFDITNLWFATIFIAIGLGGIFPLALALPLNATSTSSEAGAWTSMMQGFGYMLGGTFPFIAGLTRDYILYEKQVFVLMIILCVVLFITLISLNTMLKTAKTSQT